MGGFRPAAATAWSVGALMWGVLAVALGGERVHQEWANYRFISRALDGASGSATVGYSVVEVSMLLSLAEVVWIALSLVWLATAIVHRFSGDRPGSGRLLAATCAVVAVAVAATTVLFRSDPWSSWPLEPRLLTPSFVAAIAIVLAGVAALAISRWPLRD